MQWFGNGNTTNGNRESLTYSNGVQETYTYNKANWITELVNAKNEEVLSSFAYTYYASGSQKSETDHTGTVTTYTYDDLGRLTQEQTAAPEDLLPPAPEPDPDPDPEPEPDPDPDPDPNAIILTLDANGGTVTPGTVDITDVETYSLPTPTRTGYTFDGWYLGETEIQNGDPVTITESCTLTAQWTPISYQIIFSKNGGTGTLPTPILCEYDEDVTLPITMLSNGLLEFTGWSTSSSSGTVYPAGSTVRNLTDEADGIVILYARWSTVVIGPIDPNPPIIASYGLRSGSPLVVTETISYTYDAAGNRSQMTVSGEETYTTAYTYDNNNRLLTEAKTEDSATVTTTYTYDANGNTLTVSTPANGENEAVTKTYTYNRFNQQIGLLTNNLPTAQYTYNAQGIRISKTVGTEQTSFLLDGGNVVAEIQGDTTTNYLRGVNLISKTTDTTEYYLFNAHGDVVNLTNATGATTKTYDYDAFGNERNPDEADTNPFRYCGEYWDVETGTYYLRARYYDPAIGRFTQQDTHWNTSNMIYGDNPQKINEREDKLGLKSYSYAPQITAIMQAGNLYVYCGNNPVPYIDPIGCYFLSIAGDLLRHGWEMLLHWIMMDGPGILGDGVGVIYFSVCAIAALAILSIEELCSLLKNAKPKSDTKSIELARKALSIAAVAPTPLPPDDPNSKGTKVTSHTLHNKNGVRIDVENPGHRPGQIHIQTNGEKYIYDIQMQQFRTSSGELAPPSIQNLLNDADILKALLKGLQYLGY